MPRRWAGSRPRLSVARRRWNRSWGTPYIDPAWLDHRMPPARGLDSIGPSSRYPLSDRNSRRRHEFPAGAQFPMSVLDDGAWDHLLSFIEKRRGVPIIGPEAAEGPPTDT